MALSLFEQMSDTYTLIGDYLLPNLILLEQQVPRLEYENSSAQDI